MSDNTLQTGTDAIRTVDGAQFPGGLTGAAKTPVSKLDIGGEGIEALVGNPGIPMLATETGVLLQILQNQRAVLVELMVISQILKDTQNGRDDLDTLRTDIDFTLAAKATL